MAEVKAAAVVWDGSHLGNLMISSWRYHRGHVVVQLGMEEAICNRFDSSISLIADELKPIFGLPKLGRHRGLWADREVILTRLETQEEDSLDCFIDETVMLDEALEEGVRRAYAFRWILGMPSNWTSSLWLRGNAIYSYREVRTSYDSDDPRGATLPQKCITRWFGEWSGVDRAIRMMLFGRQLAELRLQMDPIIRRLDPGQISWLNQILRRVQQRWYPSEQSCNL